MRKYENYQDSGLDWLGEIPSNWEVKKLKQVAESVKTGSTPSTDELKFYDEGTVDWFAPSDFGEHVVVKDAKKKITSLAVESGNAKYFEPNSVLLVGIGATLGKVGICETGCSANQQINAISFKASYDPHFATYYLKAINQIIVSSANASTLPILNQTGTKELYCVCPPLPEQRAIAAYLDRKTAQLDTLLAQKEALLQKLHQKRQALINEAVTQGLDPAAPRKPSGVAWLGDVPAHWDVRRMKTLSTFVTSGSRGWAEYYSDEGEVFLRIGNLSTSSIDLKLHSIKRVTPPAGAEGARTSVQENDLLISITALLGAIAVVPQEMQGAYVNQHIALVRLKLDLINPRWAAYFLSSAIGQHQFRMLTNGGTKEGLTLGDIASLRLLYPPYAEQQAIVDSIEARASKIDKAAAAIHTQIQTLKAYRQSLISEVVTGKVDVRAAEPLAPEADLPLWRQ